MNKLIIEMQRGDEGRFNSRDIRNYIGSITEGVHKEVLMHHKKETPSIVYSKPKRDTMVIYSFTKAGDDALFHAAQKVMNNRDIHFSGAKATVLSATVKEMKYSLFNTGMYEYETRTPMVIGTLRSHKMEVSRLYQEKETLDMIEFIRCAIAETIESHTRHWFGNSIDIGQNLIIMPRGELKTSMLHYNETQSFPAVSMRFVSNIYLPQFVGYKIGLGYGELRHIQTEKRFKVKKTTPVYKG